ncbi:hypothetical protein NP233_g12125 [Leucocoprinus birnbaumii]|uniref:non-specific serine/threonine protein kinase n=1 Tax=Leucocoprinus birnbaumii TaxID=56174 RepID=A0AAD5VIX3_9AGAR|nr:hypothetical protein NP233_g12125 [Leucocoprinus birnbaumii]
MLSSVARRLITRAKSSARLPTPSRAFSEESLARYCQGGYHPVRIGDVFANGRYEVLRKLGYGLYSTVWLAFDSEIRRHVALKLLTADCYGHEKDTFELDILRDIRSKAAAAPESQHILSLLDTFEHVGPNGKHVCLVFKAMGPDMSRFRREFPSYRIPIPLLKSISRQLLLALAFLHDTCQVIHSDIKPEIILIETTKINVLFEMASLKTLLSRLPSFDPPNDFYIQSSQISSAKEDLSCATEVSIRLADFGTGGKPKLSMAFSLINPEMLRTPEVILGAKWDRKIDIWNLGLIIWELAQGALIFDGRWSASAPYTSEAHLAQMEAVLGKVPQSLLSRSRHRDRFFDGEDQLLVPQTFPNMPLETIFTNPGMSESDKVLFLDMIKSMIQLEPRKRPDARSLLESAWLN